MRDICAILQSAKVRRTLSRWDNKSCSILLRLVLCLCVFDRRISIEFQIISPTLLFCQTKQNCFVIQFLGRLASKSGRRRWRLTSIGNHKRYAVRVTHTNKSRRIKRVECFVHSFPFDWVFFFFSFLFCLSPSQQCWRTSVDTKASARILARRQKTYNKTSSWATKSTTIELFDKQRLLTRSLYDVRSKV